jgi:hypothetical protein
MNEVKEEIKKKVREFIAMESPELAGEEPKITTEEAVTTPEVEAKLGIPHVHAIPKKVQVFTFKKIVVAEDGVKLHRVTRVTVDEDGNIIKSTGN